VGVDDWARRNLNVLGYPGRSRFAHAHPSVAGSAESLATWLQLHPGADVIDATDIAAYRSRFSRVVCGHFPVTPFNRPISAHFSAGLLKMAKFGDDLRQAIAEAIEETASGVISEIATEHVEDILGGVQRIEETRQVGAR
jgi:hypothetical protein